MTTLQFGVMYSDLEIVVEPTALAAKYEDLGYDVFWMPAHVLNSNSANAGSTSTGGSSDQCSLASR